jgi:hypothetical protein
MTTSEAPVPSLAMLFTDALGQVVFVDHTFLRLMNLAEAGSVAGEPLHKALGMEQKAARQLLEDLRAAGHIQDRQLELQSVKGRTMKVVFTGVATYDESGTFLGADLTLRDLKRATNEIKMVERGDVIKTRVQQLLDDDAPVAAIDYVELYFKTQMEALHVLLVRLMGLWVRDQLDAVINEQAEQHGWGVRFRDGLFCMVFREDETEMYRILLGTAADYAVSLIGARIVAREMQTVDANMDSRAFEAAFNAGVNLIL